ncbi:hypothetical protein GLOTRDRAFT_115012 [Gloeophyllum trabeum ATCC 11539]|uniref:ABC transporter domain-containing protein n=1 Tax=Gloeophyllum trabeum (strain ATCC 11539 / FP-39264 / Madison 617) TaxID=670483 RepID=S7QHG6_GLOTA|nr:uncharacterized protein GLOTRDRAFT_115012 [Gloeophyllum trabeum ATCC 11539]EPQ58693.1 hypothetical protein GLOTRDRAFT_115012 [Gloeophyllum trabeum ATCC 11539]
MFSLPLALALAGDVVNGQATCSNYGVANGSSCACPPGFGGSNCSQAACEGNIFQGSQRQLVPLTGTPPSSNVTGCSCESGWTGTGCNVCQNSGVCQNAYSASGHAQSSVSSGLDGSSDGQNSTLTCNTSPRVWAAGEMSCQVNNPTVQALYPGDTTLNILRTLQSSLTPVPNVTAFGNDNSVYAQLFYNGVEQFYCRSDSCTQDTSSGGSDWSCSNLACHCIPGTTFCGGVPISNLTGTIDGLSGSLGISCGAVDPNNNTASCSFQQSVINSLFGSGGLTLSGCSFGECVAQSVIDSSSGNSTSSNGASKSKELSGGVIAGLAVVGALLLLALILLLLGWLLQRRARKSGAGIDGLGKSGGVSVVWTDVNYVVLRSGSEWGAFFGRRRKREDGFNDDKVVLDGVSGRVEPGQMMAILGPSGAGKTTLVEILAGKNKVGHMTGSVTFPPSRSRPHIGFVPQQDILPPTLTVFEALLFAARLRLPESVPESCKMERVEEVMNKLGIAPLRNVRIGDGERRGISGGEMRRVSIGLELVAKPDVLILDEPTSGLDSVSASKVAAVLHSVAHDPENPTAVIASIHQPSSQLYRTFDQILVLSHGRALYSGPGSFAPVDHFASQPSAPGYPQGYNVADYLLEIASDPPLNLFKTSTSTVGTPDREKEKDALDVEANEKTYRRGGRTNLPGPGSRYAATFLTQLEVLSGREWKILKRDKSLFITHVAVASVLGVFCGGLYYQTGTSIAGFQSRVGCLFFLGALIAFSSLSALYNVVQIRPLFLRERSSSYYSPTAWLLSRFLFDVVPLRLVPTIIVSSVTYWMAGLAPHPANFFKFLFILVLYSLAMTLWNFFLAASFRNGGIAILLSALSALYQMTFAGFFVHLNSIPPVLRWLQWLCPLKYSLEALSVNEVGSGLMIQDSLQGVPVNVSASLIMQLLFGFGVNNYYRDVLVLFAFIVGFAVAVIAVVWFTVRERR